MLKCDCELLSKDRSSFHWNTQLGSSRMGLAQLWTTSLPTTGRLKEESQELANCKLTLFSSGTNHPPPHILNTSESVSLKIGNSSTQKTKLHLVVVNPRKAHSTSPVAWSQPTWSQVPQENKLQRKTKIPQHECCMVQYSICPLLSWRLFKQHLSQKTSMSSVKHNFTEEPQPFSSWQVRFPRNMRRKS